MPRVYYYKLTTEDGGAPCVQDGLLSLAICKPMIRSTADPGDLIFGFAADSLHRDNRLLYVAQVTSKAPCGEYYTSGKFTNRHDPVYELRDGHFEWRRDARYHGPSHLAHDLGEHPHYPRANVLLSADFRYFGVEGTADYKTLFPLIKDAIEHLGQGHRVHLDTCLEAAFCGLKEHLWSTYLRKVMGKPTSRPSRNACHRSRSCGVLDVETSTRSEHTC